MICVEIQPNNILTVKNDILVNAVSESVKHETIKFLFSDNWKGYQKTAVFSASGVEPINVLLDEASELCISKQECYIPFEVLKGDWFYLSVFGVNGDSLATTTKAKIEVLESGYALGDKPSQPTQSEYSQMLQIANQAKEIAQKLRQDAENGLFKGEKGEKGEDGTKGEKGDKGDPYVLTDEDKNNIANKVQTEVGKIKITDDGSGNVTIALVGNTFEGEVLLDGDEVSY